MPALYVAWYNFCPAHMVLTTTPAVAASFANERWTIGRPLRESARATLVLLLWDAKMFALKHDGKYVRFTGYVGRYQRAQLVDRPEYASLYHGIGQARKKLHNKPCWIKNQKLPGQTQIVEVIFQYTEDVVEENFIG